MCYLKRRERNTFQAKDTVFGKEEKVFKNTGNSMKLYNFKGVCDVKRGRF